MVITHLTNTFLVVKNSISQLICFVLVTLQVQQIDRVVEVVEETIKGEYIQ